MQLYDSDATRAKRHCNLFMKLLDRRNPHTWRRHHAVQGNGRANDCGNLIYVNPKGLKRITYS